MQPTYTREEIRAAFARWLSEVEPDSPPPTDPDELTKTLCDFMDKLRT